MANDKKYINPTTITHTIETKVKDTLDRIATTKYTRTYIINEAVKDWLKKNKSLIKR